MDKSAQAGVPGTGDVATRCAGACERVASPAEAMMQASVAAGLMACREEFGPSGLATQGSSTRDSVSVTSGHEPVPLPQGQSAQ